MKPEYIFIRYAANPDWPDNISHKDRRFCKLTKHRTKKFELNEYEDAWKFILECVSPITKLSQILWAFPRKKALDIMQAMDGLSETHTPELFDVFVEKQEGEYIETTLKYLEVEEKSYSELLID